jgi:hypothetical protein
VVKRAVATIKFIVGLDEFAAIVGAFYPMSQGCLMHLHNQINEANDFFMRLSCNLGPVFPSNLKKT